MTPTKKRAERGNVRQKTTYTKGTINPYCEDVKPIPDKIAVLTIEPRLVTIPNQNTKYSTRILEIDRDCFKLEKQGLRRASGVFFKLDRTNYQAAKHFLCSGVVA